MSLSRKEALRAISALRDKGAEGQISSDKQLEEIDNILGNLDSELE